MMFLLASSRKACAQSHLFWQKIQCTKFFFPSDILSITLNHFSLDLYPSFPRLFFFFFSSLPHLLVNSEGAETVSPSLECGAVFHNCRVCVCEPALLSPVLRTKFLRLNNLN